MLSRAPSDSLSRLVLCSGAVSDAPLTLLSAVLALPVDDLALAAEAPRGGVDGWHALDGPLCKLKDTVRRALEANKERSGS
ncbi:MAG: hypothetical protein ACT4TC_00655 [Myxococcaceae bacterium]